MTDNDYMELALQLAKKGEGLVNPNPMVGAIIVKDNEIIGRGYHEKYGGLHAERNALANCNISPEGSTMYVTLEPCCHYGKTPPCTEAIIKNKIKRVVIGVIDDNKMVGGKGVAILKNNGIEVVTGILEKKCRDINNVFFHYIKTELPYVVMKYAVTMDGKIATYSGSSKWVTGESARKDVHGKRNKYKGIMVGIGTVLKDDPMLDCRIENGRNPVRIIVDSSLRIPLDSNIVKTSNKIKTIVATITKDEEKIINLRRFGVKIIVTHDDKGKVDLSELMKIIGSMQIDSILLEGGGTLNWSMLDKKLVNEVHSYISPKLVGGAEAKSPVEGKGIDNMNDAIKLINSEIKCLDDDFLIESEVKYSCLQE